MQAFLTFALLGLGLGGLYSLASQGLLVVYRGSGLVNFAQGAVGMVGAYVYWELQQNSGVPVIWSLLLGVVVAALLGAAIQLLVMRPLRRAAPIVRIVATLGILIILQAAVLLRYGAAVTTVSSALPLTQIHLFGSVYADTNQLILLGIACVMTAVLWWLYKFTAFGRATSAAAENQRAAAALGWSPERIAVGNWALGSGLGGLAAILIAPIVQLQAATMTNLVLAALAAALIAGFRSFPICLAAGVLLGIGQTELGNYVDPSINGFSTSFPFLVIVVVMIARGRALPLRDVFLQRMPAVGGARLRPLTFVGGIAIYGVLLAVLSTQWQVGFINTFGISLVLLSVVVVTGYTGQISLAQFAIAGCGAYIAARVAATQHWPFLVVVIIGIVGTVPIGMLFALPAVRARGINLGIVTFGLGTAVYYLIFNNPSVTGGFLGTVVSTPKVFGYSIDPILTPRRYAIFGFVLFILGGLVVSSIRHGSTGRQMIAVRTNERAAAALGVNVPGVKLYAFGLAGGLAAAGGIVLAFQESSVLFTQFDPFTSIYVLGWAVLGGVGFIYGTSIGAWFAPGALGAVIINGLVGSPGNYLLLIGGAAIVLMVLQAPDGAAAMQIRAARPLAERLGRVGPWLWKQPAPIDLPAVDRHRVEPKTLVVDGVVVRYPSVVAVDGFSTRVEPGKVVGLIGPNGAGKTTFIDAATGFTTPSAGSVFLDDRNITRKSVSSRARLGISRSFQSLELFEDLTVLENLRTASDPRTWHAYLRDLVWPSNPPLPGPVVAAIKEFHLEYDVQEVVENLSYGKRRLLAIARAVATNPSVLLLDEPAAGLGDVESRELARLVRRLADEWGMAILLIEHDMEFVMSICDRVEVLDFGKVIASGTPEQIKRNPDVIAAYLGADEDRTDLAADAPQEALKR
jgi:ABC-type branched-subunit amino acid transport system ATPase component/branched-subunit amino acid ABC-type transport system permease component